MAAYSSALYASNTPPNTGHGFNTSSVHMHATVSVPATLALNDTLNFGYLPANAVVVSVILKAATQIESGATLALSLGVTGTPLLFKSSVITVGRAAGASVDTTVAAAGLLFKVPATGKVAVIGTVSTAAAAAIAGTLEVDIEFYVEDAVGSPA